MSRHITYDSSKATVLFEKMKNFFKYTFLRPMVSFFLYHLYYRFKSSQYTTVEGFPLIKGISLYLPAKNEASFLRACLESLIDVADQFILIDNGSDDGTLEIMNKFKDDYGSQKEIIVLSRPNALLVEIVQEAMSYVKYKYTLKWDGDMFAITTGKHSMLSIRKRALRSKRPKAFGLPRLNFTGDLLHVSKFFPVVDSGEPFLRAFNRNVVFQEEYGRLEHAVVPIYYRLIPCKGYYSFHFTRVRPLLRIIYRDIYLDWRETTNNSDKETITKYSNIKLFEKDWILHNFGTQEPILLKFRIGRMLALSCEKYNQNKYLQLPKPLLDLIGTEQQLSRVLYRNNKPFCIQDIADPDCSGFDVFQEELYITPEQYYSDKNRCGFIKVSAK